MSKKGKHQSVDKELRQSIRWLESLAAVKKVVLCIVECARHRYKPGVLKYQRPAPGGCIIKAYGGNGVMDVYVKVDEEHLDGLLGQIKERYE